MSLAINILAASGGVWHTLQEVTNDIVVEKFSNFQSIAVVLAAMLAAYTVLKNSSDYIYGDSRFLWSVIRPLAILVCVMEFPTVCNTLDGVVNIFARDIASQADSNFADLGAAIEGAFDELHQHTIDEATGAEIEAEQEDWSFWRKLKEGIMIAASSYFKTRQVSALTMLLFLGRAIAEIIFFVYEILASLYLGLLKLLGPITLALAVPEELKNGVVAWISRYVQISLWVPVGYILIMFLTAYFRAICSMVIGNDLMSGVFVIGIGLITAVIAATMAIPKIASWPIQSSGSANAQSGMERSMSGLLRRIIK